MTIEDPIAHLRHEHDEALAALDRLEDGVRDLDAPEARREVAEAVAFLDNEVRGHNEREEEALFPVLDRHLPPTGPTAVMRAEHRQLWDLLGSFKASLAENPSAAGQAADAGMAIVGLLRRHIDKENGVLFPLAGQVLSPEEVEEVARGMERLIAARRDPV
jgi:hemerythrin-like domain-containing protein